MEHIARDEAFALLKNTIKILSHPACTDCGGSDEMVCKRAGLWR